MEYYFLRCRSATSAQHAVRKLEKKGIFVTLSKLPHNISLSGCSYGLKVSKNSLQSALKKLMEEGFELNDMYLCGNDGSISEVYINDLF